MLGGRIIKKMHGIESLLRNRVIDNLNDCFSNLTVFNRARFFSPKHYPLNDLEKIQDSNDRGVASLIDIAIIVGFQACCST